METPVPTYRKPDFEDFICTCDDDGQAKADTLMKDVYTRLECTAEDFMSKVVVSLYFEHNASITDMLVDQWFGVSAASHDDSYRVYIQADCVEHGIAAVWKAFADRPVTAASDD